MLQEQDPRKYERDMRLIVIKDAFVNAGQYISWTEVGMRTLSEDIVWSYSRLEQSQQWGNEDYEDIVLNVLKRIVARDSRNEFKLVEYALSKLPRPYMEDSPTHDRLEKIAGYLKVIRAIGADDLANDPPLADHVNRIEQTLFDDPEAAIGFCKDLVESALKTFLETSDDEPRRNNMSQLIKAARDKISQDPGNLEHDNDMLKTLSNFGQILISIATLRNKYGTGHGRGPSHEFELPQPYVVLAANSAISMAVFLTQMHDLKTAAPDGSFKAVDTPSEIDEGEDLPW